MSDRPPSPPENHPLPNLHIGCAVWSFAGWTGDIFPAGTRSKQYLNVYSRYFPAVEGNTTFYAVPQEKIVERWKAETPADFRFCLKMPRDFTHSGLLMPQRYKAFDFLDLVSILEEKLAMVFMQLPPKYDGSYWKDLREFLDAASSVGIPLALEVRHPDWFEPGHADKLQELLMDLQIDRVILDTQPIYRTPQDADYPFICKKPDVPLWTEPTGDRVLIRYVSHPRQSVNQAHMVDWARRMKPWLDEGKEVFLFIHCPIEEHSPANARYFQQILQEQGINVHPLPWQAAPTEPISQLNLGL
jgi:uncharacterized protein YecE (DUF72 family)